MHGNDVSMAGALGGVVSNAAAGGSIGGVLHDALGWALDALDPLGSGALSAEAGADAAEDELPGDVARSRSPVPWAQAAAASQASAAHVSTPAAAARLFLTCEAYHASEASIPAT